MFTNVAAMSELVSNAMINAVDANRKAFIHMDDLESVFESWFDLLVEPHIPKWMYEKTYEAIYKASATQLAFTVMKSIIEEERQEAVQEIVYQQSPMKYYGLKQSDFI
jgi:hypothetical protein